MDWDNIKLGLAIARTGSLNRAAILLELNQTTVGRRLTALEAALETTLFARSKQGLIPTDAGEIFIARAAEIEALTDALGGAVLGNEAHPTGPLRFVGNQWMIDWLIHSGLAGFLAEYPDIRLRTTSARPETSLWRQEPGVGLWFEADPVDGALAIKLGLVPYAVYRAHGFHPDKWVSFRDETAPGNRAELFLNKREVAPKKVAFTAVDAGSLREAVAAGIGQGLLPLCIAEADQRLARVSPEEPAFLRPLYLHAHPDSLGVSRVQALMGWLRATLKPIFYRRESSGNGIKGRKR